MVRVVERTKAHYQVKEMEFGKVRRWRPERLVLECGCGERPTLTSSVTACDGCGKDHMFIFRVETAPGPSWGEADRGNGSSH
jgi:hypothetical protein